MSEGRVEELKEKIEKWQEELDTIWKDKDTDAAEVERRNLRNLINQAKREIDEIENGPKEEEKIDLEKEFEEIKKSKDNKESEKNRLKLHIEKLREEQENYSSRKNTSYREIYDEYEKQIKESEKKLEELEKEESWEEKDKKLKTCTQLRMKYEKDIKEKEKEIREVERKIEDIEFGTEEAQEEIEIINKDGTKEKVKAPKILKLYEELKKLKGELKDLEGRRQECQELIDEIYGRDKEKEKRELEPEEIAYFHGQGDRVENTRDDRRANDEYFGFEKQGKGERKGPSNPGPSNPGPKNPGAKNPEPKNPGPKNPGAKNPEPKSPEAKSPEANTTKDDLIFVTYDAKLGTYKIISASKDKPFTKEISTRDLTSLKEFDDFKADMYLKYGDDKCKHVDLFTTYMLNEFDKKYDTNKVENFIKAANKEEEISRNTSISYYMDGIYGRKHSEYESNFFMGLANQQKQLGLANVYKNQYIRFIEKHDKIRHAMAQLNKFINNLDPKTRMLGAGKEEVKKEEENREPIKKETERKSFIPQYSISAMNLVSRINQCKSIDDLNAIKEENKDTIWSNEDDINLIENAFNEKNQKLINKKDEERNNKKSKYNIKNNPKLIGIRRIKYAAKNKIKKIREKDKKNEEKRKQKGTEEVR